MFKPQRILVPMDFSDESLLSLDWAVMLAKQVGEATLYPAYVFSLFPDAVGVDVGRSAYKEVTAAWVKESMTTLANKIPKEVAWLPVYATGHPAEELAEICRVRGIDLVVMTTHGRKGISHLLHPSVAEALVRSAPCPVLVLHLNRNVVEAVHEPILRK